MTTATETFFSEQLAEICRRFHVRRLALFGSLLRNEARPHSDVDLLVEFEDGNTPGFFKLQELADAISPLFQNRHIDLVTPAALHRLIRAPILRTAKALYER